MRIAAVFILLAAACQHAPAHKSASVAGIQWIEDDYAAALAKARAEGKPLFVDLWATWCHSCLSMKRYVFADAGFTPAGEAAVFASIDQERPVNRAVVAKIKVEGLPTFLLLDPKDESVMGRWLGSGSVADLRGFVEQGAQELQAKGSAESPWSLARQGDAAQLRDDWTNAVQAYEAALARMAQGDRLRPQLLVKLASALGHLGTPAAKARCTALGAAELAHTGNGSLAADFASGAVGCSENEELRARAQVLLQRLAADQGAPLAADDRSDMLGTLTGWLDEEKRHDEAVAAAQRRKAVLLAAQKAAPDAETASTFDPHLAETLLYLGEAAQAEALLAGREKEMPADYNPPVRLANVLLREKKLPEAEQAIDRGLALMPDGPRKLGALGLKARILAAAGKPQADTLRAELTLLRQLPETLRRPKLEEQLEAQLAKK